MSDLDIRDTSQTLTPAEAFSVIANETRISILEALWRSEDRPVAFSDLRKRVGMRDSAQFNYHLKKLTEHFIRQGDDGYDFRHAGKKVVRAIFSGEFTEHPRLEPFEIDGTCATCGGTLVASYHDEQITIECAECATLHGRYPFPPGGLKDRNREEVLSAFNQRVRHLHCLAADGVCPECNGRMTTTITPDTEKILGLEVRVDHQCERCQHRLHSAVGLSLLDQSDVVSFYRDHGIDLPAEPYWNLDWCVTDEATTVLSEDPWQIRVDISEDDDLLSVVLDDDLTVLDVERQRGVTGGDTKSIA